MKTEKRASWARLPSRRWAFLALLTMPACHATETVAIKDFRALGTSLTDTRALQTPTGDYALLDALTQVRAGGMGWHTAGSLWVSSKALAFEKGIPGESISRVMVSGLSPEGLQRLSELAPAQGSVEPIVEPALGESGNTYGLRSLQLVDILPWATRFVAQQQQAGCEAGTWQLEIFRGSGFWQKHFGQHRFFVPASELAVPLSAGERVVFATGERWSEIPSLDLNFVSPVFSAVAVPFLLPLALLGAKDTDRVDGRGGWSQGGASKLMLRSPQESINLPHLLVLLALGLSPEKQKDHAVGTMFVRIAYDQIVPFADFQQFITTGELLGTPSLVSRNFQGAA